MLIYVTGKMDDIEKAQRAADFLASLGHAVSIGTASEQLDFQRAALMKVQDADAVFFLDNWLASDQARKLMGYSQAIGKLVILQSNVPDSLLGAPLFERDDPTTGVD